MKKLAFVFSIILVLGLVIGAFALNGGSSAVVTKADCCCKDSCPLKNKEMKNKDKSSAHAGDADKHACCCGDSCPMRGKDAAGKENASGCCGDCACCGDSCPMKSKDNSASADKGEKKDCCEGKESCPMKKKEKDS